MHAVNRLILSTGIPPRIHHKTNVRPSKIYPHPCSLEGTENESCTRYRFVIQVSERLGPLFGTHTAIDTRVSVPTTIERISDDIQKSVEDNKQIREQINDFLLISVERMKIEDRSC